jgi:hypothetical protein
MQDLLPSFTPGEPHRTRAGPGAVVPLPPMVDLPWPSSRSSIGADRLGAR